MSITKLRQSFEKKGCQVALWFIMVGSAIGLAGAGFLGVFADRDALDGAPVAIVIATVEGKNLTASQLDAQIQAQRSQFGNISDPYFDFQIMAAALRTAIAATVVNDLAAARGVVIDDARALALESDELDKALVSFRQQAQASSQLKPGATEQEFQELFKKLQGSTTSEFKAQRIADMKTALEDPSKREGILATYYQQGLEQDFYAKTQVTEDEVKKSYGAFMVKSIFFDKVGRTTEQRTTDANAALAEIRGGADFDVVMKKHMTTPAKDAANFSRSTLQNDPNLTAVLSLKPNETTGVVVSFGIPKIYKLVELKSQLPKDFDASKPLYTDTFRRQKASEQMRAVVGKATDAAKIEWKSPGYELVYRVTTVSMNSSKTDEEAKTELKKIIETNVDPLKDAVGTYPSTLARYVAAEQLQSLLNETEKTAFLPTYVQIVLEILNTTENIGLRLKLVDTYHKIGDKSETALALKTAATLNTGFEAENESNFMQINKKLTDLENAKAIEPAAAQEIRAILIDWSQKKLDAETDQKDAASSLDEFSIDPKTGKTLKQIADETAKKAMDEANKPKPDAKPGG